MDYYSKTVAGVSIPPVGYYRSCVVPLTTFSKVGLVSLGKRRVTPLKLGSNGALIGPLFSFPLH
jgi:hypothetical protein